MLWAEGTLWAGTWEQMWGRDGLHPPVWRRSFVCLFQPIHLSDPVLVSQFVRHKRSKEEVNYRPEQWGNIFPSSAELRLMQQFIRLQGAQVPINTACSNKRTSCRLRKWDLCTVLFLTFIFCHSLSLFLFPLIVPCCVTPYLLFLSFLHLCFFFLIEINGFETNSSLPSCIGTK